MKGVLCLTHCKDSKVLPLKRNILSIVDIFCTRNSVYEDPFDAGMIFELWRITAIEMGSFLPSISTPIGQLVQTFLLTNLLYVQAGYLHRRCFLKQLYQLQTVQLLKCSFDCQSLMDANEEAPCFHELVCTRRFQASNLACLN